MTMSSTARSFLAACGTAVRLLSAPFVLTGAALAIGTSVHAEAPAQWSFPMNPGALRPAVTLGGQALDISPATSLRDRMTWQVRRNGTVVASLSAEAVSASKLVVALTAEVAGDFGYALWMDVPSARPLSARAARLRDGSNTFHYPYDFEKGSAVQGRRDVDGQDNSDVAKVDLTLPGFQSGASFYALDTWKLSKIEFVASARQVSVGVAKTVEINQGYDTITTSMHLEAGARTQFALLAAPDLHALSALRFGEPRPFAGRMTFLYNKGWACPDPKCGIALQDYAAFADKLEGLYDIVILRSLKPTPEIAETFRKRKLAPYYYMFLGANRRTEEGFPHKDWLAHDGGGETYTAPTAGPSASWGLYDVRRADVRAMLVQDAVDAVKMGYAGIFFDGPSFWLSQDGHVGGAANGATMSWAFARTLLLQETKAALSKASPSARIGMLGDRFFDGQGIADFQMKESYGENWVSKASNPDWRTVRNSRAINRHWDRNSRIYMADAVVIGQKGANPLFIGLGWDWANAPKTTWFTEEGDAYEIDGGFSRSLESLGRIMKANAAFARSADAARLVGMDPAEGAVITVGPSVVLARDPVKLTLNREVPILKLDQKTPFLSAKIDLVPKAAVIPAERRDGAWNWTGYGFAYKNNTSFLYGDVFFREPPTESAKGLALDVSTSAAPDADLFEGDQAAIFQPHVVTFHLPAPRSVTVEGADGKTVAADVFDKSDGTFSLRLPAAPAHADYRIKLAF